MRTEVSAGGIIFKQIGNDWHVALLKDMSGNWTFPKGIIEQSEEPKDAATREIAEEIGLTRLRHVAPLSSVSYTYRRGRLIHKTVHYFLFEATGDQPFVCQKSEGIQEARWVKLEEAQKRVGYSETNKPLLIRAIELHKKTTNI
jgi:8-oxo-dGTP pyrophosphatase MutT (NUDIX family)